MKEEKILAMFGVVGVFYLAYSRHANSMLYTFDTVVYSTLIVVTILCYSIPVLVITFIFTLAAWLISYVYYYIGRMRLENARLSSEIEVNSIVKLSSNESAIVLSRNMLIQPRIYTQPQPLPQPLPLPLPALPCQLPCEANGVVLGKADGQVVSKSVENLCHLLAVGRSGSGKSALARSIAYQIANRDDVEFSIVDLENTTFSTLLDYSVYNADDVQSSIELISNVHNEIQNRKRLFNKFDVEKLSEYNEYADDKLKQHVLFIDEFNSLLSMDKRIEKNLKSVLFRARKYGIYVFAFAQTVKHNAFDTSLRAQFATRVILRTDIITARCLTDDKIALSQLSKLNVGEGFVQFSDYDNAIKFKSDYVDKRVIKTRGAKASPRIRANPQMSLV